MRSRAIAVNAPKSFQKGATVNIACCSFQHSIAKNNPHQDVIIESREVKHRVEEMITNEVEAYSINATPSQ
jgi:hypothetical protein